jgi:hypothetical protein
MNHGYLYNKLDLLDYISVLSSPSLAPVFQVQVSLDDSNGYLLLDPQETAIAIKHHINTQRNQLANSSLASRGLDSRLRHGQKDPMIVVGHWELRMKKQQDGAFLPYINLRDRTDPTTVVSLRPASDFSSIKQIYPYA